MFNLTSMFQVTAEYYKSGRQFKRSHTSPKLEISYTRKNLLSPRLSFKVRRHQEEEWQSWKPDKLHLRDECRNR